MLHRVRPDWYLRSKGSVGVPALNEAGFGAALYPGMGFVRPPQVASESWAPALVMWNMTCLSFFPQATEAECCTWLWAQTRPKCFLLQLMAQPVYGTAVSHLAPLSFSFLILFLSENNDVGFVFCMGLLWGSNKIKCFSWDECLFSWPSFSGYFMCAASSHCISQTLSLTLHSSLSISPPLSSLFLASPSATHFSSLSLPC